MTATTKQLDRNSRYADPEEARDNRFQRDGGGGVGITVERTDDKRIMIRAVQDGSPAAKAGIQVGDQILSIDGELMIERPLSDVVAQAARLGRRSRSPSPCCAPRRAANTC